MSDRSFYDAKKDYGLLGVAPPAPPVSTGAYTCACACHC